MGLFKKKNKKDFNASVSFMAGMLQYDESKSIIKIKNGFKEEFIPISEITEVTIKFNGKNYNLNDCEIIRTGILSGTYRNPISNISLCIKTNKFYFLTLSIGKQSAEKAKRILDSANKMVSFILTLI